MKKYNVTGKKILLTGATGFLGMAVLEKLLRDQYNEIDRVYVLVRASKGKDALSRLESVFNNPIFDLLRKSHPRFVNKVVEVEGDLTQPGLGLDEKDLENLVVSVETIIHCAAAAEFDLPLKEAFDVNTLGVVRLLKLADKLTKLHGIVHVSTAYVNANIKNEVVEEKLYPLGLGDAEYLVKHIPLVNQNALISLEQHVLKEYHNTFTFTKALAEHVLVSKCKRWNIAIVRPSIITPSIMDPTPGWLLELGSINGLVALIGSGIVDCLPVNGQSVIDVIPVDFVASMVVASLNAVKHQPGYKIYHATSSCINPLTWEMFRSGIVLGWKNQPKYNKSFGPVSLDFEPNQAAFDLRVKAARQRLFSAEAYKIVKKDPVGSKRIIELVAKADASYSAFMFFGVRQWLFKAHNILDLEMLSPNHVSRNIFATMSWKEYLATYASGIRAFVFERSPPPKERNRVPQSKYPSDAVSATVKA